MFKAQRWLVPVSLVVTGLILAGIVIVATGVFAPAADDQSTYIVVFNDMSKTALAASENNLAGVVASCGGRVLSTYTVIDGMAVAIPDGAIGQIAGAGGVRYIEKDRPAHLQMDQVALQLNVNPVTAGTWDTGVSGYDGSGVLIAIVDSGVDLSHPDLAGRVLDQVYYTNPSNAGIASPAGAMDLNGHGTFVASEIVGSGSSSMPNITLPNGEVHQPLKGIAQGARLISARVSYEDGSSSTKTMLDGLNWAFNHNPQPQIISISMATMHAPDVNGNLPALDEAVKRASDAGIVVVSAAGNEGPGESTVMCPGDSPYVITVGSVDRNNLVSYFSSRGPGQGNFKPDVMGAGQAVIAARPNNAYGATQYDKYYTTMTGTSMAAPEVTGIVALMLQYKPGMKPEQIKEVLMRTAHKPAGISAAADLNYGAGIVDAAAALRYLKNNGLPAEAERPVASVHFDSTGYTVNESAGSFVAKVVVDWLDTGKGPINVSYLVQSDTAIAGKDFALAPGTLEFRPDGPTELPVTVHVLNDQAPGSNKNFALKLSSADNVEFTPAAARVTLLETDNAVVRFDVTSYTVKQDRASLDVDVICDRSKLKGTARAPVSVDYDSLDGSLLSGVNFNGAHGTLTFGPDDSGNYADVDKRHFTISSIGGQANAEDMYFNLQLSNPLNAVLGSPSTNKVWVTYSANTLDSAPPVSSLSLSPASPQQDGWYTSDVLATIAASDGAGSGINYVEYSLSKGPWLKYDSPLIITDDGSVTIEYSARDKASNVEQVRQSSFKVDQQPPRTTIALDRPEPTGGFYDAGVTVMLTASDGYGSGINRTEYRLNGGDWVNYTAPFGLAINGMDTIEYRSTDNLGHQEPIQSRVVRISANPPVTAGTTDPANPLSSGWFTTDVLVTLSVTYMPDGGIERVEYNMNDGTWKPYAGPLTVSVAGTTNVSYRAISNTGIAEAANTLTIKIDKSAPVSTLTLNPALSQSWSKADEDVNLTATDAVSGVKSIEYSLDGGSTWTNYTGNFTVKAEGRTMITYHATDNAGNKEPDRTSSFGIDRAAPIITCTLNPALSQSWSKADEEVNLTATDAVSGVKSIEYSLNGGSSWITYAGNFTVKAEGRTTITYHATDNAGNAGTDQTMPFGIDKTAPIGSSSLSPALTNGWTNKTVTVTLTATDTGGSGVKSLEYGLNNAAWLTYTTPFTMSTEGNNTIVYHALDNAGNQQAPDRTQSIGIDRSAPVVTATISPEPDASGWNTGPVTVTFTATDDLSGIDSSGFPRTLTQSVQVPGPCTGQIVTGTFADRAGNSASKSVTVNIRSAALTLGVISAPSSPQPLGSTGVTISVSDTFSGGSIKSASWGWDDGTASTAGTVANNKITATHKYTKAGIYTVSLTVQDTNGGSALAKYDYVVIYDPSPGAVIGLGIFNSPAGAFSSGKSLKGTGIFAFASKYLKGSAVPLGQSEFIFHSGRYWYDDLWFTSSSNDFLCVNGNKAFYEGSGYLWDGSRWISGYKFLISSIDGQYPGYKTSDKFRMKIWNKATGQIVYDNMFGTTDDGADPTATLTLGGIGIQK